MKILILTNYANGLYLFRKELLLKFLEEGHEVVVAVPQDENCRKIGNLDAGWSMSVWNAEAAILSMI